MDEFLYVKSFRNISESGRVNMLNIPTEKIYFNNIDGRLL